MKQLDIVNNEKRKTENELYIIHFYLEGDWWRAYEWSAYLCVNYPNNLNNDKRLKATHKLLKGSENGIIFVGLKLDSFAKYFPKHLEKDVFIKVDEKHIMMNVENIFKNEYKFDGYITIFNKWKESIPYKNDKVSEKSVDFSFKRVSNMNDFGFMTNLAKEILYYNIENKTMLENYEFIAYLKTMISEYCISKLSV